MNSESIDAPSSHKSTKSNITYILGADSIIDIIDYEEQPIQTINFIYINYIENIYTFIRMFF